jgi:hypothetical protein
MYVPIDFIIFIVSYIIQMCYKINGKKSLQHRHRTAQHIEQHSTTQHASFKTCRSLLSHVGSYVFKYGLGYGLGLNWPRPKQLRGN